jgi:hypothetical protein
VACARRGEGGLIQMPKTERACSVSGVPCEMPVWGNAERWRAWVNEMEAAGGLRVRQCEVGGGFVPKTRNQAVVAWFRACRVKRQCQAMRGDGGHG